MKIAQIELMRSRAEALAVRAMLDNYIKLIQYLESSQPQNLPQHFDQEKDSIIPTLTGVENELQEVLRGINEMGKLSRRGQLST
jgi:hypothetical protein